MGSVNISDLFEIIGAGIPAAGIALFLLVCVLCYWLLVKRRYIILFLWPVLIYFYGPLLTSLFAGVPGLGKYIFPENIFPETLVIFTYFAGLIVADLMFDISTVIRVSIYNPTIRRLSSSPVFLPTFAATSLLAMVLQVQILRQYGSVLTGDYAYWNTIDDAAAQARWGFVAGLYEIVFLCFVIFLLSGIRGRWRAVVVAIYAVTAVLRVLGGTRLILVKELAFILILLFLQGNIGRRALLVGGGGTILAGTLIGLLRSGGGGATGGFLGPLYGIGMESALNALSFNIAYQVQAVGGIDTLHQVWQSIQFAAMNALPSFLRFGQDASDLDAVNPYNLGLGSVFDSISPVGGMSGFATVTYVTGYPFGGVVLLVLTIGLLLRFTPRGRFKQVAVLVFSINAIHFWRDGLDIWSKLLVQDVVCVLLFLYIAPLRAMRKPVALPGPYPAAAQDDREVTA